MKLDKRHMTASLGLLVAAVGYNLYVYLGPGSSSVARTAGRVDPVAIDTGGPQPAGAPAIDPTQVPAAPDVQLDRMPVWPNTPFAHVRPLLPSTSATAQPEVQTEPDVVVAAILMSADRRVAMVNGHIVHAGDRIGVITVVDIQPHSVVVDSPTRGRLTIELKAPHMEAGK